MSSNVIPAHIVDTYFVGTAEFAFCEDAVIVADTLLAGWRNFRNLQAFTLASTAKKLEHFGSYRGIRRLDRVTNVEAKVDYKLKCDAFHYDLLRSVFFSSGGDPVVQSALTLAAADPLAFTASIPSVVDKWYDLLSSGVHLRDATLVTVGTEPQVSVTLDGTGNTVTHTAHGWSNGQAVVLSGTLPAELHVGTIYYVLNKATDTYQLGLTPAATSPIDFTGAGSSVKDMPALKEGTDFTVDLQNCMINLLAAHTVTLYPYVSVPAITSADDGFFQQLALFNQATRVGIGRLTIWDQYSPETKFGEHLDFGCNVALDAVTEMDGQKWGDISLIVTVTNPPGAFNVRSRNINVIG